MYIYTYMYICIYISKHIYIYIYTTRKIKKKKQEQTGEHWLPQSDLLCTAKMPLMWYDATFGPLHPTSVGWYLFVRDSRVISTMEINLAVH